MPKLSFDFEWVDAEGIRGPELSATWASLRIRAGDSVITQVLDERAKTVRESVYVPLYPIAEWLAENWWFLTSEFRNPTKESAPDFHRRHALGANREGYAFPNIEVVPSGARTRLSWNPDPSPWTRIEFLSRGEVSMDSSEFRETCADFVDRVIRRLAYLGVGETFLQEEWGAIQAADGEESRFCETAAGLGWDPYALDDVGRDRVLQLDDKLGDLLDEAIPALNANDLDSELNALEYALGEARLNGLPLHRIETFCAETGHRSGMNTNPWNEGYDLARRLRHSLALNGDPLPTMAKVADALDEDADLLDKVTRPANSFTRTPLIDGVVTRNDGIPAFAFRQLGENARRFHFCRALAEVLTSSGSDTLLTRAHSERQQRNRAFAAEFLAPSSGLTKIASGPVVDGDEIDEIAVKFGVSPLVIEHQIENHRIASVWRG